MIEHFRPKPLLIVFSSDFCLYFFFGLILPSVCSSFLFFPFLIFFSISLSLIYSLSIGFQISITKNNCANVVRVVVMLIIHAGG